MIIEEDRATFARSEELKTSLSGLITSQLGASGASALCTDVLIERIGRIECIIASLLIHCTKCAREHVVNVANVRKPVLTDNCNAVMDPPCDGERILPKRALTMSTSSCRTLDCTVPDTQCILRNEVWDVARLGLGRLGLADWLHDAQILRAMPSAVQCLAPDACPSHCRSRCRSLLPGPRGRQAEEAEEELQEPQVAVQAQARAAQA